MTDDPRAEKRSSRERLVLAALLLAVFGAMLFAKALASGGLEQTAMFYVGIPALIAVTVVLTARPRERRRTDARRHHRSGSPSPGRSWTRESSA